MPKAMRESAKYSCLEIVGTGGLGMSARRAGVGIPSQNGVRVGLACGAGGSQAWLAFIARG